MRLTRSSKTTVRSVAEQPVIATSLVRIGQRTIFVRFVAALYAIGVSIRPWARVPRALAAVRPFVAGFRAVADVSVDTLERCAGQTPLVGIAGFHTVAGIEIVRASCSERE